MISLLKNLLSQHRRQTVKSDELKNLDPRDLYRDEYQELEDLLKGVLPAIKKYYYECGDKNKSVPMVRYKKPSELQNLYDWSLPEQPQSLDTIYKGIQTVLDYSVKTLHPHFMEKLYCGTDPIGALGELLTAILNTNVHTFSVSPVLALIETTLIKELASVVGYDPQTADGIVVPGGSYANLIAFFLARHKKFPHVRKEGWRSSDKPVVFCGIQSHYSISRAAMMGGMGMDNCIGVKTDIQGRMEVDDLEAKIKQAIENGQTPFFVNANNGSTVMGGIDHFDKIGDICKKYGVWFHIDACWGGHSYFAPNLFSELLKGTTKSDSISLDPHKGLGAPLQMSIVLTNNHLGLLQQANASGAHYLFHEHEASEYDLGDKTLQCGRRADAFKFWLQWKRYGKDGFRKRVEKAQLNKEHFLKELKKRQATDGSFILVADPLFFNICFWYVPIAFRGKKLDEILPQLGRITEIAHSRMQKEGTLLINYNPLKDHGLPLFFRLIINQPRVELEDIDFIFHEFERTSSNITPQDLQ